LKDGLEILVERAPNITRLEISNNEFTSFDKLKPLDQLQQLQHLHLYANPFSNSPNYRTKVFQIVKKLSTLDGMN